MDNSNKCPLILAVEDNANDRMLLREAFDDLTSPHKLIQPQDEESLVKLLRNCAKHEKSEMLLPDAILLDVHMPNRNGLDILAEIRNDPLLCKIPVFIFSGDSSENTIIQSYDQGATGFIEKPSCIEGVYRFAEHLTKWLTGHETELPTSYVSVS